MTQAGTVYGEALYSLCLEEKITESVLQQLQVLQQSFDTEPDYLRLLAAPSLSKEERCQILDQAFRDQVHIYVLNFLKILTEKGYIRHFGDCCKAYLALYHKDNGILPVTAVTAIALTQLQCHRLEEKLASITGKTIQLHNKVDPAVLGGIRLDFDGKRMDDTIAHRLDSLRNLLQNTVL